MDVTYPVDEVSSSAFLSWWFNAASAVYLIITAEISAGAMNWILTGCCGFCGVLMLAFKEVRLRQRVDDASDDEDGSVYDGVDKDVEKFEEDEPRRPLLAGAARSHNHS